jgi:two-component sensor histidine kinase
LQSARNVPAHEAEFRVRRPDGDIRWCLGTAAATLDEQGEVARISGVTMDITERKRAEERQAFLAREVDHRARNVLAVVQSMLRLTRAETTAAYVAAVEGRINALSRAHMLLAENRWQGADLRRLVDEELEPYLNAESNSIEATGPSLLLDSRRAQTVALTLHELATNAVKHGALALPFGKIRLAWRTDPGRLVLDWAESGGPPVVGPSARGYGMRVINASVEQLAGKVQFDWRHTGMRCNLMVPLPNEDRRLETAGDQVAPAKQPQVGISPLNDNDNVLVVEDESLVAMMMAEALAEMGFSVVGPFGNTTEAIRAVNETSVSAAILDINLGDELVYPVADLLTSRGIPFAFITGYGSGQLNRRYPQAPVLLKPVDRIILREFFGRHPGTGTAC